MSFHPVQSVEQADPSIRRNRKRAKKRHERQNRDAATKTVAQLEREGFKVARRVFVGHASAFARMNGLVVERDEYDPCLDVACQQMRVPYGKVERGGTAGQTQEVVIEAPTPLDKTERRRDCLLNPVVAAAQRETYRRNRAWADADRMPEDRP